MPPSGDHRAIIELLRSLEPAESPTDFHAALPLLKSAVEDLGPSGDRAVVYLLSDFRSGSARLEAVLPADLTGDTISATLLAAPASQHSIANTQIPEVSASQDKFCQYHINPKRPGEFLCQYRHGAT